MKVVFLDIDGVLVTGETVSRHVMTDGIPMNPFAAGPVAQLNRVLRETGAEIVVSSSWRCDGPQWDALMTHFAGQGVDRRPIGKTPWLDYKSNGGVWVATQRGDEIRTWLVENPDVEAFVAVDDDRDMDAIKDNFVWVEKGMFNGGLGVAHADQMIAVLNRKKEAAGGPAQNPV